MGYCARCDKHFNDVVKFCSECGSRVEAIVVREEDKIVSTIEQPGNVDVKKKRSKWLKAIIAIVSVLLVMAIGFYIYSSYMTNEGKAKTVANHYLKAIKNGASTYDYKKSGVDDFINVLDYRFLRVTDVTKEDDSPVTFDTKFYNDFQREKYNSFDDFKNKMKDLYTKLGGKVVSENDSSITVQTGNKHDKITMLYDVNVTNGLGQGVYKKVYITLENDNSDGKFKVSSMEY